MLQVIAYAHEGVKRFPLGRGRTSIGSGEECDICLPHGGVAPLHASLVRERDEVRVIDLGSEPGVLLNGKRVQEARIAPLDEVRIGQVTLLLEEASQRMEAASSPTEIDATADSGSLLIDRLAQLSSWVIDDLESHRTVEGVFQRILSHFGGGAAFLWSGDPEAAGTRFIATAGEAWLGASEPAFEWSRRCFEDGERRTTSLELPNLPKAWALARRLSALERRYVFAIVLPESGRPEEVPLAFFQIASELLVLGLVHHVGRYEPILPGYGESTTLRPAEGLVLGSSPASERFERQLRAASLVERVALVGERGCGRLAAAETLHRSSSSTSDGPFVVCECSADPRQVAADLFGAEVAGRDEILRRTGKIESAHGGTLVLIEVEELDLSTQGRLARFLRTGAIQSDDGASTREVRVRVLSVTRRDLRELALEDRFRVDLVHQLSQFAVEVPALRARREDIPLLVQRYTNRFVRESGNRIGGFTVRAMNALTAYGYPGNLRELENVVRQCVLLCPEGEPADLAQLPAAVRSAQLQGRPSADGKPDLDLAALVNRTESAAIREALRGARGNKSQAARSLGISRNSRARKMKRLEL